MTWTASTLMTISQKDLFQIILMNCEGRRVVHACPRRAVRDEVILFGRQFGVDGHHPERRSCECVKHEQRRWSFVRMSSTKGPPVECGTHENKMVLRQVGPSPEMYIEGSPSPLILLSEARTSVRGSARDRGDHQVGVHHGSSDPMRKDALMVDESCGAKRSSG